MSDASPRKPQGFRQFFRIDGHSPPLQASHPDFSLPSHDRIADHPPQMKPSPWILPAAALLLGGAWIVMQGNSVADLRREITLLRERVLQARSVAAADDLAQATHQEKPKHSELKDLVGKLRESHSREIPDIRTMIRMQRLLMDLSPAELSAQLDEIATLDIAENIRGQLLGMIMGALVEKDPKLALDRFVAKRQDNGFVDWQMGKALRKWADQDPAAAFTWLDHQIAAGTMDSKSLDGANPILARFEISLAGALLKTDPATATARVMALNDTQREEFFQQGFFLHLEKGNEAAYAKLIRDTMPAEKARGILADAAGNLASHGNYERVDDFIANSQVSDDEKQAIISKVLKTSSVKIVGERINTGELEKARAWGNGHMPAAVDQATGEALAHATWQGTDFDAAAALAVQYSEASGNDETLAAFLRNDQVRRNHPQQAAALIAKIKDPALRAEISGLKEFHQP
jgi:hypothetical protein